MPFSKFIVFPIFVALQAAIMMLITPHIKIGPASIGAGMLLTWVSFQSWAMYFLGGCTPKMAGKTIIGYICGIVASVAIFTVGGLLGSWNVPGTLVMPLAVFIIVIPIMCSEKIKILDFIPAWFMGAAVFFALSGMFAGAQEAGYEITMGDYVTIAIPEMIACVVGLGFGVCTVSFRKWYEKMVMPQTEEETEQVKKSA
jgi:hypothetical protein